MSNYSHGKLYNIKTLMDINIIIMVYNEIEEVCYKIVCKMI